MNLQGADSGRVGFTSIRIVIVSQSDAALLLGDSVGRSHALYQGRYHCYTGPESSVCERPAVSPGTFTLPASVMLTMWQK